ncbi:Nitrilase family, member 2 [Seminavis robusta]|uniref:Nitrilase family, member 2 n=1 Tax=Seminavis robusta TaxID=568900 RepID=A0A9N8HUI6_9STRA|nr:Nitrilase family, member 2 [Seminavis robusta]|eukprot:Sro1661_g289350.1 Nitrilase family, member 2 (330) ;mRNA; f:6258-7247
MSSIVKQNISSVYAMYCNPNGTRRLSNTFQPGKYDVLCARGKKAHNSEGNKRFRTLVSIHAERYAACSCKMEKSRIVSHIVDTVRRASPHGGFVKLVDGVYWEAGDRAAKEKVGQTFRDILHNKYSSSTKAKARARMEKKIQNHEFSNMILPQNLISISEGEDEDTQGSDSSTSSCGASCMHYSPETDFSNLRDTFEDDEALTPLSREALESLRSSIHTIVDPSMSSKSSMRSSSQSSRDSIINLSLLEPLARSLSSSAHRSSMSPIPLFPKARLSTITTMKPQMSLLDATMMEPPLEQSSSLDFTMDLEDSPMDEDLKDFYESMGMGI